MKAIISLAVLASAITLAGCSKENAGADSTQVAAYVAPSSGTSTPTAAGSTPGCPSTADVKSALGFDVRELTKGMKRYGPLSSCGFTAADENALPGVTVQLTIEPGSEAEQRFADMRQTVTVARGSSAEPDPIAVGERGMAYTTSSRTMAAAVSKGQLYSVDVHYGAVAKFGDKQAGTVTLLRKLMGA